eukprot:3188955-Rhodomonas_salina.3
MFKEEAKHVLQAPSVHVQGRSEGVQRDPPRVRQPAHNEGGMEGVNDPSVGPGSDGAARSSVAGQCGQGRPAGRICREGGEQEGSRCILGIQRS